MPLTVWNQLGPEIGATLRARDREITVVDIPLDPPRPPTPAATVLFAAPRTDVSRARLAGIDSTWAASVDWVHTVSAGIDGYPPSLLAGRRVSATKDIWSDAIAEYVLAAILTHEKRFDQLFSGRAVDPSTLGQLDGSTVGLVGFGAIGRAVARRLLPFGARLLATRRSPRPAGIDGVEIVPLERLLASSDHVVLALAATEESIGLIGEPALRHAKPGLHLVNVARGQIVDQAALLAALNDGRVGAATLDVTEPEPLPPGHALRDHPNVRISPHVAGGGRGLYEKAVAYFSENLRRFRAGEPLNGEIDPGVGY